MPESHLNWTAHKSGTAPEEWAATATDPATGEFFLTKFYGPHAGQRAHQYIAWLKEKAEAKARHARVSREQKERALVQQAEYFGIEIAFPNTGE